MTIRVALVAALLALVRLCTTSGAAGRARRLRPGRPSYPARRRAVADHHRGDGRRPDRRDDRGRLERCRPAHARWRPNTGRSNMRRRASRVTGRATSPALSGEVDRGAALSRRLAGLPPVSRTPCFDRRPEADRARHGLPQCRRQLDAADLTDAGALQESRAAIPPIRRSRLNWQRSAGGAIEGGMLFWIVAALLTLGASLAVLLPLASRHADAHADGDHDLEVYRDQLAELDRDAARGLIRAGRGRAGARRDRAPHPEGAGEHGETPTAAGAGDALRARVGASRPCLPSRWSAGAFTPRSARLTCPRSRWRTACEQPGRKHGRRTGRAGRSASCRQSGRRPRLGRAGADLSAPRPVRRAVDRLPQRDPARGATAEREAGLGEAIAAAAGGLVTRRGAGARSSAH